MNVIINYQQFAIRFSTHPAMRFSAASARGSLGTHHLFVDSPRGVERLARRLLRLAGQHGRPRAGRTGTRVRQLLGPLWITTACSRGSGMTTKTRTTLFTPFAQETRTMDPNACFQLILDALETHDSDEARSMPTTFATGFVAAALCPPYWCQG